MRIATNNCTPNRAKYAQSAQNSLEKYAETSWSVRICAVRNGSYHSELVYSPILQRTRIWGAAPCLPPLYYLPYPLLPHTTPPVPDHHRYVRSSSPCGHVRNIIVPLSPKSGDKKVAITGSFHHELNKKKLPQPIRSRQFGLAML